jgi:hypothetical protein
MHAAPVPHWQVPLTQLSPGPQAGSQGTSAVQVPLSHTKPPVQAFPQIPQWLPSDDVSTHAPSQQVAPSAHDADAPHLHSPSTQVSPSAHAGSHGAGTQLPSTHSSPASQRMPQPPQAMVSLSTSTQRPSQQISLPSQGPPAPH